MRGQHCTDYAKNRRNIVYVDFLYLWARFVQAR